MAIHDAPRRRGAGCRAGVEVEVLDTVLDLEAHLDVSLKTPDGYGAIRERAEQRAAERAHMSPSARRSQMPKTDKFVTKSPPKDMPWGWGMIDEGLYNRYHAFLRKQVHQKPIAVEVASYAEKLFDTCNLSSLDYGDKVLSRGELELALRSLRLHERLEHLADPSRLNGFVTFAFDAYSDGRDGMTLEEFQHLFARLEEQYPAAMPHIPRKRLDRAAAAAAEEATRSQFELMKVDDAALLRLFNLFDADGSGCLDAGEIVGIIRQMGIPDYERDGYRGFIERAAAEKDADVPPELDEIELEFDKFKVLLQALVTCKVDPNYRTFIMKKNATVKQEKKRQSEKENVLARIQRQRKSQVQARDKERPREGAKAGPGRPARASRMTRPSSLAQLGARIAA